MSKMIRYEVKNWHPSVVGSERILTVHVGANFYPTDDRVIDWPKAQQPFEIAGEKWQVVKSEIIEK